MKKLKIKSFLETALKMCVCAGIAFAFLQVVRLALPSASWCGDLFEKTEGVLGDTQGKLVHLAMAIFPVSLIVLILNLFFTKDERKVGMIGKACIVVCVAAALIMIIDSGTVLETIKTWLNI